jgi:hypothetical protein
MHYLPPFRPPPESNIPGVLRAVYHSIILCLLYHLFQTCLILQMLKLQIMDPSNRSHHFVLNTAHRITSIIPIKRATTFILIVIFPLLGILRQWYMNQSIHGPIVYLLLVLRPLFSHEPHIYFSILHYQIAVFSAVHASV